MENILSILSFNSLYTILISILTMCVMYYGVNRFSYVINIFLYMLSRTLIGFVVSKFLVLVMAINDNITITFMDFLANFVLGLIIAKLLEKFADSVYSMGVFVFIGVIIEFVVALVASLLLGIFV